MGNRPRLTAATVVVGAVAIAVAGAQETPPAQTIEGVWHLDRSRSEAPARPAGRSRGHGRFGARGGGMGGPGGGMGGPGAGAPPEGDLGPGAAQATGNGGGFLAGAEAVKIVTEGNEVHIISADGHVRIITPDGSPAERERGFMPVTETANWDGDRLVVTSSTKRGLTITETFGLADDGSGRLVHAIAVKRPGARETRNARWVYDRSAPEQ